MSSRILLLYSILIFCPYLNAQTFKLDLPVTPVGMDAYRMWDLWPQQRIGVRAYMRSTYDRDGANQSADAGHYLFANEEDQNVSLDVKGKGILYFFRANHWHGSPWHFIIDGKDNIIKETGTSDPLRAKRNSKNTTFIPEAAFPEPLNWTWSATKGADLIWTPMPFKTSLRIAYARTRYGTGYYIYHLLANEKNVSRPIRSWNISERPDADVLELINRSGTDIAPKMIKKQTGTIKLDREKVLLASIKTPASSIRAVKLILPLEQAMDLERIRLQVTWDGATHPSIDAPLCLFFGAGTLYNRENREYLVKGFPVNIRFDYANKKVELACYYPMPFFKSARFELAGIAPGTASIGYEIRYEPSKTAPVTSSYFHATYTDIPQPEAGKDMIFLDTKGAEGHQEWSGSFVGNSFIFSHNAFLGTLEGDPRFFFDDSQSPQAYGTGTEEWGGGGDYWGGENMTLPFAGHPCGAVTKDKAQNAKDRIESAYRFLLADMMPFGRRAVIGFEHGGENLSTEHYEAVSYWYGLPAPSLIKTDSIDIGNIQSEKQHAYTSPEASPVVSVTSRYELGIDQFPASFDTNQIPGYKEKGREVYPAHTEDGRYTRGASNFVVHLAADNQGVLLRRTLDYSFPNQTALVSVADVSGPEGQEHWVEAGVWYLAGANTALYSDPPGELDPRWSRTQTSNRRFRDDEFLIPAKLTKNRSAIKVKIAFVPDTQQLFPDFPFPKPSAWSELRYAVYSYILPKFTPPK
ncbi:MAG: DUF2961 domain-containing protein [Niabella sp.]|nr:DUF2961 domain-containing protein [Niabella sp.]